MVFTGWESDSKIQEDTLFPDAKKVGPFIGLGTGGAGKGERQQNLVKIEII